MLIIPTFGLDVCDLCALLRCLLRMDKDPLQRPIGSFMFLYFFCFYFLHISSQLCLLKNKTAQWMEKQESRSSSVQNQQTEGPSREGARGWRDGKTETGGRSYFEIHHHHHHLPPFFFFSDHCSLDFFPFVLPIQNIRRRTRSTITARTMDRQTAGRTDWLISGIFIWRVMNLTDIHLRSPPEKQQRFLKTSLAALEFSSGEQFKALELILAAFKRDNRTEKRFAFVLSLQFSAAAAPSDEKTSQTQCFLKWPLLFYSYSPTQSPQLLQHF